MKKTLEERFWNRVSPEPNSGCWLWTGYCNPKGYSQIYRNGAVQLAHRVSYEMHVKPISADLQIDHLCRVRCCVNPDHLEPVTPQQNMLRGKTIAAENAAKTHCAHGHEFTEKNTYLRPDRRGRQCRTCKRERQQRKRKNANREGAPVSEDDPNGDYCQAHYRLSWKR